jgi:hypothetical protein
MRHIEVATDVSASIASATAGQLALYAEPRGGTGNEHGSPAPILRDSQRLLRLHNYEMSQIFKRSVGTSFKEDLLKSDAGNINLKVGDECPGVVAVCGSSFAGDRGGDKAAASLHASLTSSHVTGSL